MLRKMLQNYLRTCHLCFKQNLKKTVQVSSLVQLEKKTSCPAAVLLLGKTPYQLRLLLKQLLRDYNNIFDKARYFHVKVSLFFMWRARGLEFRKQHSY